MDTIFAGATASVCLWTISEREGGPSREEKDKVLGTFARIAMSTRLEILQKELADLKEWRDKKLRETSST